MFKKNKKNKNIYFVHVGMGVCGDVVGAGANWQVYLYLSFIIMMRTQITRPTSIGVADIFSPCLSRHFQQDQFKIIRTVTN